jgi:hypothetical protein
MELVRERSGNARPYMPKQYNRPTGGGLLISDHRSVQPRSSPCGGYLPLCCPAAPSRGNYSALPR